MAAGSALTQFGITSSATSGTSFSVSPPMNLPIGTVVVMGVSCNIAPGGVLSASDTGGNTWTKLQGRTSAGGEDTLLALTVLTTALTTSSSFTFSSSVTVSRTAVGLAAFSDAVWGPVTFGTMNETSTTAVAGGSVTPSADSSIFGMTGFVSSGRTFTPAAGWTAGIKFASTAGSGNRAVQLVWRNGVAATSYTSIGTLDTSGVQLTALGSIVQGTAPTGGGGGTPVKVWSGTGWITGSPKVWSGTAWVPGNMKVQ